MNLKHTEVLLFAYSAAPYCEELARRRVIFSVLYTVRNTLVLQETV